MMKINNKLGITPLINAVFHAITRFGMSVFGVICWVFRGYSGYNWPIRCGIS